MLFKIKTIYFLCGCLFIFTAFSNAVSAEDKNPISVSSLIVMADDLVTGAISSNANASRFRIDATLYRESLRSLMISMEKDAAKKSSTKKIFMELVRMSALIQSAAACKTGRFIVCPMELRQQLLAQQKRLHIISS